MNKKLRLVVTDYCHNQCPMCCNKLYDITQLPVVDRWDYDEVMITGGEPSMFSNKVRELVESIRVLDAASGKNRKIYMYTAVYHSTFVAYLLDCLDGIVASPHNQRDVTQFVELVKQIEWAESSSLHDYTGKSFRLNLFPEVKKLLPPDLDLSKWQIKDMEWLDECPIPDGEDLRRIDKLFV